MTLLKRLLLVVLGLLAAGLITSATGVSSPQDAGEVKSSAAGVNSPEAAPDVTTSAADVTGPLTFVGITPCRIVETRPGYNFSGQAGPPALIANQTRTFQITGTVPGLPQQCGIPSTAVAISVNFTVTGFSGGGDLRIYPAGSPVPLASIINFQQENVANATNMPLGVISGKTEKGFTVRADGASTDFIADVNGYFVSRHLTYLEKGQTERGSYAVDFTATAVNQHAYASISFPVPISGYLSVYFMDVGAPATSACPGSSGNPTAAAGNVCIYEETSSSIANPSAFSMTFSSTTVGAVLYIESTGPGHTWTRGIWAATAP